MKAQSLTTAAGTRKAESWGWSTADPYGRIRESNETNNTTRVKVTIP
jgi:hypothetical protein